MPDETDHSTDQSLKAVLREATAAAEVIEPDPVVAVQQRVARRRRRRRSATVVVAVAVLLVVAGIVTTIDQSADDESVDIVSPSTTAEPNTSTTAATSSVPTTSAPETTVAPVPGGPPLALRADVALAWTGAEVVVWGGGTFNDGAAAPADGAAFDPATGAWRAMSAGPLPAGEVRSVAAMTDAGVVIARGTATAIWDPGADTWRALDDAPALVTDLVADGELVLSHSANAVLDVDAGTWRTLPAPPVRLERPTTAWTGDELIVIGGPNTPFTSAAAIAFDPDEDRWRTLPAPPTDLHAEALSAAWDGGRVVVVNYDMTAATYDPATERWELLPAVPARFNEHQPSTVSAGGTTVTFMAQAVAVLREGDQWEPLPYGAVPNGATVVLGDPATAGARAAIWSTDPEARTNALSIVDLASLLSTTQRRQVGSGSIELAPGDVVRDAMYEVPDGGLVETVRVTVGTASGGGCTISSTSFGGVGPAIDQPVREELPGDAGPRAWYHDAGALVWVTEATTSDQFGIACDDPLDARRLATTARFG